MPPSPILTPQKALALFLLLYLATTIWAFPTPNWLARLAYSSIGGTEIATGESAEGSGEELADEVERRPLIYEHWADKEPEAVEIELKGKNEENNAKEKGEENEKEEGEMNGEKNGEEEKNMPGNILEPRLTTTMEAIEDKEDWGSTQGTELMLTSTMASSKSSPFAKPTLACPDGSLPEFSLHGSTYCWSHSVCPRGTVCTEGQCCQSGTSNSSSIRKCDSRKQWECADGLCVPIAARCDGHGDCRDEERAFSMGTLHHSTDELYCPTGNEKRSIGPTTQLVACPGGGFRCREDGTCIPGQRVCDHHYDCRDGSDELRCDYFVNAQMREEAKHLQQTMPPTIHVHEEHQQQVQCGVEQIRCPDLPFTHCIHYSKLCDGVDDCGDGSDERGCNTNLLGTTPATCAPGEFQCHGSTFCIPSASRCDRHYDCRDGSDELDCDYFREAEERRRKELEEANRLKQWQQQQEEARQKQAREREKQEQERMQQEKAAKEAAEAVAESAEAAAKECHQKQDFPCPTTGQCLPQAQVCDGRPDCADGADERNCDELQITVYPAELSVREGREASFECRARAADNSAYPDVRWTRVGGRLPDGVYESGGRLVFPQAQLAHTGRYVCMASHRRKSVEAYAQLHVQSYGPQEFQGDSNAVTGCMANERACGSNECVKIEYVCDGERDCRDGSDELNCPAKRHCEPNEFRCHNDKCVQKMWLCDGDDDCGDRSDELNCGQRQPGDLCQPTEFRCADGRQCVPQSFQCDGTNDCQDGSDEIGCVQPTVVSPPQSNLVVPQGDEFKLTCRAVGVPDPYINWRLNWDDVCEPPRCQQVSEGGVGTLTVQNAQPMDQGAYTCEAINVKGRVLATPDCIVRIVSIPAPQPPPPPPAEPARLTCHATGSYSPYSDTRGVCQCKPLTTGSTCSQCSAGAYNLDERAPQGCLKCFCFGVADRCHSSSLFRTKDVTCEKMFFGTDAQGIELSDGEGRTQPGLQFDMEQYGFLSHKEPHFQQTLYWKMPQRFQGNKVTAYGGDLAIKLQYEGSGQIRNEPLVLLKGNGVTLVHRPRDQESVFSPGREFTVTVPTYEQHYEHRDGRGPASREDLMMALADLDLFLIRATHTDDQTSTSLGDTSWEIAVGRDTQEERALEVEQCECPPGYIGTSCEDCAPGYERAPGPYLGVCVPARRPPPPRVCPPGYHGSNCEYCSPGYSRPPGDPRSNICVRCECHNHASHCDSEYGTCVDCQHNTEGDHCEQCRPGYVGDARRGTPHDCVPEEQPARPPCQCYNHSPRGCDSYGRCIQCEHQTEGFHCEVCKKGYYGDATRGTPYDCTPCPCPGDRECFLDERGQVQCKNCPPGYGGRLCDECAPGYTRSQTSGGRDCEPIGRHLPSEVEFVPAPEVALRVEILQPKHLSIHDGGRAKWTCKVVSAPKPELVDIQWSRIGHNELPAHAQQHGHQLVIDQVRHSDAGQYRCTGRLKGEISTDEATLNIVAAQTAPVQHQPVVVPPPFSPPKPIVTPPYQLVDEGQQAVFTCLTPGYADCEVEWHYQRLGGPLPPGWQRRGNQIIVHNAQDIHVGDYLCSVTHQFGTTASDPGRLEIRKPQMRVMVEPPEQTVDLGDPARFRCWVPGVPEAVLTWRPAHGGQLAAGAEQRDGFLNFPRVQPEHPGQYICAAYDPRRDPQGANPIDSTPVQLNIRAKKPFQPLVEPPYQIVDEGQPLPRPYRCWVPGHPQAVLKWRPALEASLPSGVEQLHGGAQLNVPRAEMRHAGDYVCAAYDPHDDPQGERVVESTPVRLDVRRPAEPVRSQPVPPQVDPPRIEADIGQPARFRCWVPGQPDAQVSWAPARGGSLPDGAVDRDGNLIFQSVQQEHEGQYVCSYVSPEHGELKSPPVSLEIRQPKKPLVDPPEQTVQRGSPSRIRCWVPGDPRAQLRFTMRGGRPLPDGARDDGRGNLYIARTMEEHEGEYECHAHFPHEAGRGPEVSEPALINVNPPPETPPQTQPTGEPPQPVATPPQQTVPRGEPARFHCEPNSKTPAQIHWGFGSPNGALPSGVSVDGQDILIHAADEATIGDYHCSATNEFGRGYANPVHLSVTDEEEPPTARVEPKVWNGKPGDSNQFRCYVTGNPYPTIQWTGPNGENLPEGVVDLGDGVLEIVNASIELHNGEYTCTATNPLGEASDSGKVNIGPSNRVTIVDEIEKKPAPQRLKMIAGEPLELRCEAEGEPEPDVEWLHDPGPERGDLPDDFVPITISEQFLRHPSIGLGNSGCYTCRASNQFASVTKGVCIEVIEPSGLATVGILGGQHQWFPAGHPAEVVCAASVSSLIDRVEWSRAGGGELPDGANGGQEQRGVLKFESFKPEDAGEYECNAYRKEEVIASSKVELHVEGDTKPELLHVDISPPSVRVVNQGDSIVLDCVVHGDQTGRPGSGLRPLTYIWLHGRHPQRLSPLSWCPYRILHLKDASPEHAGLYAVQARLHNGRLLTSRPVYLIIRPRGHSGDEFQYSWSLARGGSLIRELGKQSQLHVKSADPSNDYGIYRCEVESQDGEAVGQAQAAVSVGQESADNAVESKYDEDSEAVLTCPVFVVPGAQVQWSREDGDELPEGSHQEADKLIIDNFNDAATGVYRCSVQYGQSSVEGYLDAKIFVPDTTIKVLLNVSSESVQVGDRAWLDCIVVGDPNARVEFLKDDSDELPENAQVSGHRLLFNQISVENTGKYRCRAHTSEGPLETSALLNVESDEETEAEKRRRKHLGRPRTTSTTTMASAGHPAESGEGEGGSFDEEEESVETAHGQNGVQQKSGPEYTFAAEHPGGHGQHAFRSDMVEIGRPAPDHPSARRRLRRLRHQRRRALGRKEGEMDGPKEAARKHRHKKRRASERAANLRRRAERYRNGRAQFQKYYHHYEIRSDAPSAPPRRHSLFGAWFWH